MSPISLCCECVSEKEAAIKPYHHKGGKHKVRFAVPQFVNKTETCEDFNTHRCNMMGETQVMCGIVILLMQLFLVFKLTVDHVLPVVLAVLSGMAALTGGGFGLYAANTKLMRHIVMCMLISISSSILAIGVLAKTAIDLEEIVREHQDDMVLFEMVDVLLIVMSSLEFFAATAHWILCLSSLRKSRRRGPREFSDFYEPCIGNSTLWFVPTTAVNLGELDEETSNEAAKNGKHPGRRRHFSSEMTANGQLIMADDGQLISPDESRTELSEGGGDVFDHLPVVATVKINTEVKDLAEPADRCRNDSGIEKDCSEQDVRDEEFIWILKKDDETAEEKST
ncbi:uncharacterized protein LOC141900179 [Tubulanus polymorphus]|uniref:uncharacterized protein LOC141900179 n=1 Tax=Tubulanus polymorphus TaxID=672921 RepID=UPI003DA3A5EB